jgi:hypothetical protein
MWKVREGLWRNLYKKTADLLRDRSSTLSNFTTTHNITLYKKCSPCSSCLHLLSLFKQKTLKMVASAGDNQCEVVLVGCGAPKRGMGWYHAVQMIKGKCPSAKLCFIVEPWFMGAGRCTTLMVPCHGDNNYVHQTIPRHSSCWMLNSLRSRLASPRVVMSSIALILR